MRPEHLLEQAEGLIQPPEHGAPRQADKRRAVSASYYALFHSVARATANQFVGGIHGQSPRYALVYRSVTHGRVSSISQEVLKPNPRAAYRPYWPPGGFGADMQVFANAFIALIQARHAADYDPQHRINTAEVRNRIAEARAAVRRFEGADADQRAMFVTLLLCEPRGN